MVKLIMKTILSLFSICALCFFTACGSSGSDSDSDSEPQSVATNEQLIAQLSDIFGVDGNLWKPKAEEGSSTSGLLVVLLSAKYTNRFDSCELEKIDGSIEYLDCNDRVEWSHEPFSCVANGGREHWRSLSTCDQAAQVRVVCRNATEVLTVEATGPAITSVCDRHG